MGLPSIMNPTRRRRPLPPFRLLPLLALLGPLWGLFACGSEPAEETIYWCSMHPDVRQPEPGTCALCGGMRLVPLDTSLLDAEPGVLRLEDVQIQQAGVRLDGAERRDLIRTLDLTGRFTLDPRHEWTFYNPIPGSSLVVGLYAQTAGSIVTEGQVLIELENDLLAQQVTQLRDAISRYEELRGVEGRERSAAEMLKRKESLLDQLEDSGVDRTWSLRLAQEARRIVSTPRFPVQSTADGVLLRTPTTEVGRYARQGEALFRLADPSQLWLELDARVGDLGLLEPGQRMRYSTPAVPERELWTSLDAIETVGDSGTPKVRVRARASSAKGRILAGTWARATVEIPAADCLSVPSGAVLQSGGRDVALVALGEGRFRPVAVTLGRRDLRLADGGRGLADATQAALAGGRYHEVLEGLEPGDRVVAKGSFLLLSEASFQGALETLAGAETGSSRPTPPQLAQALEAVLVEYENLRAALAADDGAALAAPTQRLQRALARLDVTGLHPSTAGAARRLRSAAADLQDLLGSALDLEVARARFGAISRETVALVRDHAADRVEDGRLHLFRCPMADDYGFDLWLQATAEMANPYMGQRMLACGTAASL